MVQSQTKDKRPLGREEESEPSAMRPVTVRMSDVKPEAVKWLWPERIALGKFTVVCGDPGLGKSFLSLDFAARVSQGRDWPDGTTGIQGDVLLLGSEDDDADTIRPRLDAAGADVSRIERLAAVGVRLDPGKPETEQSVSLATHVTIIAKMLLDRPNCRLMLIDPLSAFLGSDTDSHKNADMRRVLSPYAELAAKHQVAIVGIEHLNKRQGVSAIYRMQGSIGIAGQARAVWAVIKNPDDLTGRTRLFLPIKNNLGNDHSGLSFQLTQQPGSMTPCVAWGAEPITKSVNDALDPPGRPGPEPEAKNAAADWLKTFLADGPKPAADVYDIGTNGESFSKKTIQRAKKDLGVKSRKEGLDGKWFWSLPEVGHEGSHRDPTSEHQGDLGDLPSMKGLSDGHEDTISPRSPGYGTRESSNGNTLVSDVDANLENPF